MSPLRVLGLAMVAVVAAAALADPENGRDPVLVCAVVAFAVAAGIFLARELPLAVGLGSLVVAGLAVLLHAGGKDGPGSFKAQFKRADASGARFALILGADELAGGEVSVKPLRGAGGEQQRMALAALPDWAAQVRTP